MTSLLPRPTTARPGPAEPGRPLALVATTGGVGAALATLVPCLLLAVVGWFLTDAGAHGTPRDALQVGALGWLVAHGSGVSVRGTAVTVLPLGLTLLAAWATWRVGRRAGEALSGHGPDADRLADGERDWTVPGATALFAVGYAVTVVVVAALAADPSTAPSTGRALGGALLLAVLLGGTGLAVGSGRAAVWLPMLPGWCDRPPRWRVRCSPGCSAPPPCSCSPRSCSTAAPSCRSSTTSAPTPATWPSSWC